MCDQQSKRESDFTQIDGNMPLQCKQQAHNIQIKSVHIGVAILFVNILWFEQCL